MATGKVLEDPKVVAHVAKATAAAVKSERTRVLGAIKGFTAPEEKATAKYHKVLVTAVNNVIREK